MIKRSGAHRGEHYTVSQFSNDWIMGVRDGDTKPEILNPVMMQCDDAAEMETFRAAGHTGIFWKLYEVDETGLCFRFIRRTVAKRSTDLSN